MKKVMYLSVFVALLFSSTGNLSGQSVKETRNVSGFDEISFGIAGNLNIKIGSQFSVVLQGDKDYLADIETVVKNGRLVIRKDNGWSFNNEKADVFITLPALKGLGVSGSGVVQVEDPVKNESLDLSVSGSGKLIVNEVVTGNLDCSISGSGNILMKSNGEAGNGNISISGSGNFSGETLKFKNLETRISGSGSCTCSVTESLEASISGSGNVNYYGNPKINARVSGSGHVRSR